MDPRLNPYSPGAGNPPPEFAGRNLILEQADIMLDRIKAILPDELVNTLMADLNAQFLVLMQPARYLHKAPLQ